MPPNQALSLDQDFPPSLLHRVDNSKIRVAILGCGMMGQEHISYIAGYPNLRIDFLCDPHEKSLTTACKVIRAFNKQEQDNELEVVRSDEPSINDNGGDSPQLFLDEDELMEYVHQIDLLVIASPNYLHTPSLLKWARHDINILVEKPVAVSQAQLELLQSLNETQAARIWVAMEYRYIPAIAKLRQLLPDIGDIKMITIRENRYPFLTKIGDWNRDTHKTGDTLVEKCCHFWDLFRLLTGLEIDTNKLRSIVQRGLNYQDEDNVREHPIIDSAYVVLPFLDSPTANVKQQHHTIGCLELCMYAEGSRHQEEIIVTGTKGRLEAYLPENKVFFFQRPNREEWVDRSVPPARVEPKIFDCSNVQEVHDIDSDLPTHGGYHYSSTSVEWYYMLQAMQTYRETGEWQPHVSLEDGIRAVEAGLSATDAIVNGI